MNSLVSTPSLTEYAGLRKTKIIACMTLLAFIATSLIDPRAVQAFTADAPLTQVASIEVPQQIGVVRETFQSTNMRSPLVVQIQDAHANYDAQKNISEILRTLHTAKKIDTIFTEGAEGDINVSLFREFPLKEAKKRLMDKYMKEGKISATEEYAITADTAIDLIGVDDEKTYFENVEAYIQGTRLQDASQGFFAELDGITAELKSTVFSPALCTRGHSFKNLMLLIRRYAPSGAAGS